MLEKLVWEQRVIASYLEDWMIIILLISVVFISIIKIKNENSLKELFTSIFKSKGMAKESMNQFGWTDTARTLLISVYFLIIALFFTIVSRHYSPGIAKQSELVAFFGVFFISLLALYTFRLTILYLIKVIAGPFDMISEYSFSVGQNNRFIGVILIPITFLIVVMPSRNIDLLLYIGLGILLIIYLLRILRLIINSLRIQSGIFYIILYLCTFEFLPFMYAIHLGEIFEGF